MKKTFILFLNLIVLTHCTNNKNPLDSATDTQFGFFFLKNESLTTEQVQDQDVNKLQLAQEPFLSIKDIDFYDFSTHCIYLKDSINAVLGDTITVFNNVFGKPFVVVADGQKCYLGCFLSSFSSWAPNKPFITDFDQWYYANDIIHIRRASGFEPMNAMNYVDIRSASCVEKALKENWKLRAGISLNLLNIKLDNASDTATVVYTYEIINNEYDPLYVLDPDKMGIELFNYFCNGVSFQNENTHFSSEYRKIKSPDVLQKYDIQWFSKLAGRKSIQRTVTLHGYRHISPGQYYCQMDFSFRENIQKSERNLSDGRIWIGEIYSNVLFKKVN